MMVQIVNKDIFICKILGMSAFSINIDETLLE